MRRLLLALVLLLIAGPAFAEDAPLNRLVADYEAFDLSQDPFAAAHEGDRAALSRLPDVTPAADALRKRAFEGFQARLSAIDPAGLSTEARLNRDFLAWTLDRRLKSLGFDEARLPFNSDSGFDEDLDYSAGSTNLDTEADARAWIARLQGLPAYYAGNVENARRGVRSRFTQPRTTVEAVVARAKAEAARPVETDPLLAPFDTLPAAMPATQRAALKAEGAAIVRDRIRPAQAAFLAFLQTEYLPAARTALAARSLPNGEAYYRWLVADHTTTDLTPDQIHEIGLSEVKRIRGEMAAVIRETGFQGDLPAFIAMLRKDPRFYVTSREALLEKAALEVSRIEDPAAPAAGRAPRAGRDRGRLHQRPLLRG